MNIEIDFNRSCINSEGETAKGLLPVVLVQEEALSYLSMSFRFICVLSF